MIAGEWDWDIAKEVWQREAWENGHEEDRQHFLGLLNQGLTIEEIKERLQ